MGAADPDVSSVTAMQNSAQSWELSEHIREKQGESESPAHLNTIIYTDETHPATADMLIHETSIDFSQRTLHLEFSAKM